MTSGKHIVRVSGFAQRGARHIRSGRPCEDAFERRIAASPAGEVAVLAIADGHGSCRHAARGAALAVEIAVQQLLRFHEALLSHLPENEPLSTVDALLHTPFSRQLVQAWVERVQAEPVQAEPVTAASASTPASPERTGTDSEAQSSERLTRPRVEDYGATLLCALLTSRFLAVLQLGDGNALWVQPDGTVGALLAPDPLCMADETPSLCLPQAWLQLRRVVLPPPPLGSLVLLSTDGYANSYADTPAFERVGSDYLALIQKHGFDKTVDQLPTFLSKVSEAGAGDDVTLGLLYLQPVMEPERSRTCPDM